MMHSNLSMWGNREERAGGIRWELYYIIQLFDSRTSLLNSDSSTVLSRKVCLSCPSSNTKVSWLSISEGITFRSVMGKGNENHWHPSNQYFSQLPNSPQDLQ